MTTAPKPAKSGQRVWTAAQREEQSRRIRAQQIWKHATGPRTEQGKRISSQNSYKHGRYTFGRKVLGWYIRLAALRVKQAKIGWMRHEQNYRNELIARGHLYDTKTPSVRAFFPYFRASLFTDYIKTVDESSRKPQKSPRSQNPHAIHAFFSELSGD